MAAHRAEGLRIVDEIDHGTPHQSTGVLAGDHHDFLHPAEHEQLAHDFRGAVRFLRLSRQASEASNRLAAHVFVRISAGDFPEHIDLGKPADRRSPHTRVGVFPGEREQRIRLLGTQLIYGGRTHPGIGVLPTRLWPEFLENTHLFLTACKTQARIRVYTSGVTTGWNDDRRIGSEPLKMLWFWRAPMAARHHCRRPRRAVNLPFWI